MRNPNKIINKALKELQGEQEQKPIYTSYIEDNNYILEEVVNASLAVDATPRRYGFICYNKATGETEEVDRYESENQVYEPIVDDLLEKGAIILPSGVEEYGTTKELVDKISKLFSYNFEVPKFFEKFLPYLCLFYWVYDKFPFVPYLHFIGRTTTGKTCAMEAFGSLCYKPIDASGSITISPIFRTSSTWRGTLMIDEFDSASEGYKDLVGFLKSGTGDRKVLRTEGDKSREVRAYLAKSPKIFTSENPIEDSGLQSRTIMVMMNESTREIPLFRLHKFYSEAEHIRNQLLLWRFRNLNKINLENIEFGFKELRTFDRRVQQVVTPIYYLADEEAKKEIIGFASNHQEEIFRMRRESLNGIIFEAITQIYVGDNIPLTEISDRINSPGREEFTPKKIINNIRKVLGFEAERIGHDKIRTIILKGQEDKISEMSKYYGINSYPGEVATDASDATMPNGEMKLYGNDELEELIDDILPIDKEIMN